MARFEFRIELHRKDGSTVEAGRFKLEHPDYNGLTDRDGLQHVTSNPDEFGYEVNGNAGYVQCGGVVMALADFDRLQVELVSKSVS